MQPENIPPAAGETTGGRFRLESQRPSGISVQYGISRQEVSTRAVRLRPWLFHQPGIEFKSDGISDRELLEICMHRIEQEIAFRR